MPTIVLEGPGKNALSTPLMEATLAAVRAAGTEPIFLMGAGDCFSAGLNLKEVSENDVPAMAKFLGTLEELVKALYEHPAPVVAFVNGHAIAGGCVLALTADLRIATARPNVRLGLNEVALGLRFPPLTWSMVRARVPAAACERVVLEAALYDVPTSLGLGLIDRIGEEADARAAYDLSSSYPRGAYATAKKLLRGTLTAPPEELRIFREETIPYWTSEEQRGRIRALLKKK